MTTETPISQQLAQLEAQAARADEVQAQVDDLTAQIDALSDRRRTVLTELTACLRAEKLLTRAREHLQVLLLPTPPGMEDLEVLGAPRIEIALPEPVSGTLQEFSAALPQFAKAAEVEVSPAPKPKASDAPSTNVGRVTAWVQGRTLAEVFTVADAMTALALPYASVAPTFSNLLKKSLVERLPGTGTSSVPSVYRLPGSAAEPAAPAPTPEPAPQPDPEPTPVALVSNAPSTRARILDLLQAHPGQAYTAEQVAGHLNLDDPAHVAELLTQMSERGAVEFDRDSYGIGLTRPAKPFEPAAPAGPAPVRLELPAIPDRLNVDERLVFDALRREPAGLTEKLLASRLNWKSNRLAAVLDLLLREGHAHRVGDRLRAGNRQEKVA